VAKGIIGELFIFSALFLDTDGTPLAVLTPTIEVFYFDHSAVKVNVVPIATPMTSVVPVETGRYIYSYTIDAALQARQQLYAVMRGIHPVSGDTLVTEVEVDLFDDTSPSTSTGVTASFIGPDNC
jgi:hypothetical protein